VTSTRPPGGTRDFLPHDIRRREHVIGVIRKAYERHGFEPLETPAFENIETLLGKYGDEGNRLIFKILRRGEHEASGTADLALRYDLTVPLARVVAEYQDVLPRYFKRYQIQPVWRADRPARGRFREFYQCDVDGVGSTSPIVEAEVLAAVCEALVALGFADFRVRLNHRRLLGAVLAEAGVAPAQQPEALVALDKLDKAGPAGVEEELASRGIPLEAARALLALVSGGGQITGAQAVRLDEASAGALTSLGALQGLIDATAAAGRVHLDLSLARGLSYYTGAIMEIGVPDLAGSLGGGGRYDNLIGTFLGRDVPACGFSLGLERIIVVMSERDMFPPAVSGSSADVLVAFMDDELRADALRLAGELRGHGLAVDVFPEASRRPDKPLKYAAGRRVPFLAVLGQDERARGEVALRDLGAREQENVARTAAAEWMAARRGRAEHGRERSNSDG
jgi:histidyl-tRNA synthetase